MLPELTAGVSTVSTWSLLAVVASGLGVWVPFVVGRSRGFSAAFLAQLAAVVILAGWLGAKAAHVLFEAEGHAIDDGAGVAAGVLDLLRDDPWHWARLLEPGFVFYGGVIVAVLCGLLFVRDLPRSQVLALCDLAVPGVLVGIAVGRLGCFVGGCCYGAPTELPWAVHFPLAHATHGAGVHPVQLYDIAVAVLGLGAWALAARKRLPDGAVSLAFCGYYAVARGLTEVLRADADRGAVGPLSTSQLISIIVLAVLVGWLAASRMARWRGVRRP